MSVSFRTELLAGLTTFGSMAYILVVNPSILSQGGMDFGAVLLATIITTIFSTAAMGLYAKLPIAVAPGMGVSTYVTFAVMLTQDIAWQQVLAGVLIVALFLLFLNLIHVREKLLRAIPTTLLKSATAGIGLFLIFVALRETGLIETGRNTISFHAVVTGELFLVLAGLIVVLVLDRYRIQGAMIIGIFFVWGLSLLFGYTNWQGVFSLPPSPLPTLFHFDFSSITDLRFLRFLFILLLVTLFDSSSALLALERMLQKEGMNIPNTRRALIPDSIGSIIGACFGTASMAIHLESASGIKAGGKTGTTALIVALCFAFSLFIYPLISSIPSFASAPILILIGFLMLQELKRIDWKNLSDVIPALITTITMPLTFSIYLGFTYGFISFALLKLLFGRAKEISLTCWIITFLLITQLLI